MPTQKDYFTGKVVLVTGAGGSIGSEICRKLVEYDIAGLKMVGHSEEPLYNINRELYGRAQIQVILGSVTDAGLMSQACQGVDIVIHAAAHKHVPLCEQNPVEAITNNVGGTIALAEAAAQAGVKQFVMVSSDKAVKPASIMGATKRACELFIKFFSARSSMRCTTVRFGNVLNSSGSVLPLWREQLAQGKPITLTDKRCTRYFMSIPDAVELTLGAASLPRDGLYVLDMGAPQSMYRWACKVVAAHFAWPLEDLGIADWIVETGLRPGEKLEEELSYGGTQVKTPLPRVFALDEDGPGRILRWADFQDLLMAARCKHKPLSLEHLWRIVS
jgi:FlaA1/EpsC-like NDP-sugar epimerase